MTIIPQFCSLLQIYTIYYIKIQYYIESIFFLNEKKKKVKYIFFQLNTKIYNQLF